MDFSGWVFFLIILRKYKNYNIRETNFYVKFDNETSKIAEKLSKFGE